MGIEEARKYLKNNELVAVPFNNGMGFCDMNKPTYEEKLTQLLVSEQFERHDKICDSVVPKIEEKKT